ncbi:alpha/beta fold hydrolase [Oxynema aestuarii]|uniref:Alpha/beta fold hydrolase n=1 Tax=Oxynema aestuarii AP17 TaxID=2064643 RepID=A0A6H1TZL7_9CYAN|nr:alpha/beta fold hydrolase [Oxynema aestuarii]QIZ72052.1 alpha/beta fold hydrolase [Oxynema aestuarii AP17]RMH76168.1 MAG: alpha/beta fold hydrolase [Cyanobacteria bacterium J007]
MTRSRPPFVSAQDHPLGVRRDWIWRGYQIRYTYIRSRRRRSHSLPILLLHGFGSALGQWRANLHPLSEDHTVYALDFLGFGASEKASTHYRVGLWADLVYDFWHNFIGREAIVVGHSLGSLVALTAVATYPEMARGLALLTLPDPQPRQPPAWARALERFFSSPILLWPLFQLVRQPGFLRKVLRSLYTRDELVDRELVELFAAPARDRGALEVFYRLSLSRNDPDYSPDVAELLSPLTLPILLIWGESDRVIPFAGASRIVPLNPRIKLVSVPDTGHVLYDERPEAVNDAILGWIDGEMRSARSQ